MTDDDIKRALELVNYFRDTAQRIVMQGSSPFAMKVADLIDALLNEVEHWKAEAASWEKQASDRVDDAVKFAAERDALARDAARYRWLSETTTFTDVIETAYSSGLTYHVRRWFHDSNDQFDTLEETVDAKMKGASDES